MTDAIFCYHCRSDKTNKAGLTKNKKKRYYCRSCRRFSRENPAQASSKEINHTIENNQNNLDTENKINRRYKPLPSKGHLVLHLQARV